MDRRRHDRRFATTPGDTMDPRQRRSTIRASLPTGLEPEAESITALLQSHADAANVRLRVVLADGQSFLEARPPNARSGPENDVPIQLTGSPGALLRGALPVPVLESVASVIQGEVQSRTATGAHRKALETEQQRLSLLFEFSEKVCQLAALDEIVARFLGDVVRILEAREGTFFALDKSRQELYIRCQHGSRPDVVSDFRLKVGEGIAGAVAKDGRARIVNDVVSCPDYVAGSNPIRNIISAPITVRGSLLGVVNVNDRIEGKLFTSRDLQLLVSLARMGGIALDNAKLYDEVRQLLLATIESLTTAIDAKDQYALGHSRRVAFLCTRMGKRMGLPEQESDLLHIAALLHDIGNLAVSEAILHKSRPLTAEEQSMIKEHPAWGASILGPVQQLTAVLPGVADHHERYDGRGYPRGLKATEISVQGRLIALAAAFDAMTHDRPFRDAIAPSDALAELTAQSGSQFDPALVGIFVECYRDLELARVSVDKLLEERQSPGR
jgi:HD-GYP domain-containing protein (c-di-GMP phosphodiesterase class II)